MSSLIVPSDSSGGSPRGETQARSTGHEGSASPSLTGRRIVLAWILSLGLHVVGFGVMLIAVFPYVGNTVAEPPSSSARVVGDVNAKTPNEPIVTELFQPSANSEAKERLVRPDRPMDADALAALSGATTPKDSELSIVGIGAGGGDVGGLSLGGGAGPEFFGLEATAPGVRTIVYVVDRSGSMIGTFSAVRAELRRSISALRRSQKFHVVFFNSGEPVENPPLRPVNAVDANKREFFDFLEAVAPGGGTRPEPALRKALALEPDLIYFLSDGVFDASLLDRLAEWNRGGRTKIFTIAYLDQSGRQLLETIARVHGGEFKFVTEDDLPP